MSVWLGLLILLLGVGIGVTGCEVVGALRARRRPLAPVLDLSAAAARGDLVHLDWSDPRPVPAGVPFTFTHEHTVRDPGWRTPGGAA